MNECILDWITDIEYKKEYVHLLCEVVISELPSILGDGYDEYSQYKSVHKNMTAYVENVGRQGQNAAIDWKRAIENSCISELFKNQNVHCVTFLDPARVYLSIQASTAWAERMFGDAVYQEDARR